MYPLVFAGIAAACLHTAPLQAQNNNADEIAFKMHGDEPRVDPLDFRRATAANAIASAGDNRIDALMSGYKWSTTTITYSFYENDVHAGKYYGSEANVVEVSEKVKTNVREILAWYSSLVNLTFVEVDERTGQIGSMRFMCSDAPSYAYAYYPTSTSQTSVAGDVHLRTTYDREGDTNGFQHPAGKHGHMSLIHEIGHTLGLKHPHQGSPVLPSAQDNVANTVMSYSFLGNSSGTPMTYDILALQYLYGARGKNTGNDSYAFTRTTDQYTHSGKTYAVTPYNTKQTIWDSAGIDTLDFSAVPFVSTGYSFDMNEGGWLIPMSAFKTTYYTYGTSIGYGVSIRNLLNSSSSDTIFANPAANIIGGYASNKATGNDVVYDADSADTIDLSSYAQANVSQTQNGNDLVLGLGTNGSITLKDYYAGKRPQILFNSVVVVPSISIANATVVEGNSGTTAANFVVTLGTPSTQTVTVNYATANSSATAGSDYSAASGTLTFEPGSTSKTITVNVIGDTSYELDEVFYVNLTNAVNATISKAQGVGTILNDDAAPNVAPVASASGTPTTGYAPLAVTLNGTASYDTDGTIVAWSWNLGDGTTKSGATVTHTYTATGTYNAVLTVTDDRGATASKTVGINVTAAPNLSPVASASGTPTTGYAPLAVTLNGSSSYDPDGTIVSWSWNLGDGTIKSGANVAHSYAAAGTYNAVLTVTDDRGASTSTSISINVMSAPVVIVTMNVADISMYAIDSKQGTYARAMLTVVDSNGKPVNGATVTGTWSGLFTGQVTATTASNGTVTFDSAKTKSTGTATFTVNSITCNGYTYDAGKNIASSDSVTIGSVSPGGGKNPKSRRE